MHNAYITKDVLQEHLTLDESEVAYLKEGRCIFSGQNINRTKGHYGITIIMGDDGRYRPALFPFKIKDEYSDEYRFKTSFMHGFIHRDVFKLLASESTQKMTKREEMAIIEFFSLDSFLEPYQLQSTEGKQQIARLYNLSFSIIQYNYINSKLSEKYSQHAETQKAIQDNPASLFDVLTQTYKAIQILSNLKTNLKEDKLNTNNMYVNDIEQAILNLHEAIATTCEIQVGLSEYIGIIKLRR